jgi:hypothetical protein
VKKLTLAHTHPTKTTLKLAAANLGVITAALLIVSPTAYASTKNPVDKVASVPSVVSGPVEADSTQHALDRLQRLAATTTPVPVTAELPQLERDDFWATSQKTLNQIAAKKHAAAVAKHKAAVARHKAAVARHKAAVAQRKVHAQSMLATAPTGTIQAYAHQQVLAKGWSEADFSCLVNLWNKESGWNPSAENVSSGAYGIPQALPGSKMATVGSNWRTDYRVQINWGLGYIASSYGHPCSAWAHSQATNWY